MVSARTVMVTVLNIMIHQPNFAEVMVRRSKRHPANAMFDLKKINTKIILAS